MLRTPAFLFLQPLHVFGYPKGGFVGCSEAVDYNGFWLMVYRKSYSKLSALPFLGRKERKHHWVILKHWQCVQVVSFSYLKPLLLFWFQLEC